MTEAADRLFAAIGQHGWDSVAFQSLEPGIEIWTDAVTGGLVAYADTGRAWVGAGLPLAPAADLVEVMRRFAEAGRAARRRVSWFATERRLQGFPALLVGEQPEWRPLDWPATVSASRGLREQLRRARAAGVTVRAVEPGEVGSGSPMRAAVESLAQGWLARRHMEPMRFLVTLAPWQRPEAHRYFVALHRGEPAAFLSLVPVPARRGWLFEDLLRSTAAPNGTSELLIDRAMRAIAVEGAEVATLGLAPLSGGIAGWLRLARWAGRGLYDFRGLRAFKARLHPHAWRPVWLLVPPGERLGRGVLDALRAFTGRRTGQFAVRTILRHPSAACVALALPLGPWTLALALLVMLGAHGPLGFSRGALGGWALFDAALDVSLWWAALRPRRWALAALAAVASADASASVGRIAQVGLGAHAGIVALRGIAVVAPVVGAALLWWSALRAAPRRARPTAA
jgi:phosphatidylglycerol lysyltransferase